MKRFIIYFLVYSIGVNLSLGQTEIPEQGFMISPQFSLHKPIGDMADRFKPFSSVGLATHYKAKNGLYVGLEYDWFFGDGLAEEGTFSEITGETNQIIDEDGNFSVVRLGIRGNYATANLGYLFVLNDKNPNSGILILGGVGFMQHRIDIFSSQVKIPQLNDEYEKGYDKLTYGLATKQFIGYQYLVRRNRYHFKAGLEFNQGYTQGRRTWDYNANKSGLDDRFDGTVAFKFGVILPIYTKEKDDEEFFFD